ncbi:MAG: S24/S26 family peptidase [Ignavibacteria bacterium]
MIVSLEHLIPVIRKSLSEGKPVRFTSTGSSMAPFIYNGDEIELLPINEKLKRCDIILLEKDTNKYVLHRIVKIDGEKAFLRGDAQSKAEGPFKKQKAIGIAGISYRKGRRRDHTKGYWSFAGKVWVRFFPITLFEYLVYKSLRRLAGIMLRKLGILRENGIS